MKNRSLYYRALLILLGFILVTGIFVSCSQKKEDEKEVPVREVEREESPAQPEKNSEIEGVAEDVSEEPARDAGLSPAEYAALPFWKGLAGVVGEVSELESAQSLEDLRDSFTGIKEKLTAAENELKEIDVSAEIEVLHRGIIESVQSLSSSIDNYLKEGDRSGFSSLDSFIKNLEQLGTSLAEEDPEAGEQIEAALFPGGKEVAVEQLRTVLTELGKRARRYTLTDRSIEEEEDLFALCEEIVKESADEGSLEELAVFLEEEVEKGSTSPAVLFTLSAVYGRKGMKREAYELISIVEEETAKRPNVVFSLSLLHGRKSELKTELNTESVKYSPPAGFVLVRGGRFRFGEDVGYGVEGPDRSVVVGDFFMMEKELTFEAFDSFCDATGRERLDDQGWGRGSRPAVNVTWMEAVEYCNWISGESGLDPCYTIEGEKVSCDFSADGYRLPTEAEWEYAARGGMETSGFAFSGSDDPMEVGWFMDNSGSSTNQGGELAPNELGLYDMSGNVWEWCWDWYDEYKGSFQLNPSGPVSGEFKILRGGSWSYFEEDMAVSSRGRAYPEDRDANNGFRLVAGIQ